MNVIVPKINTIPFLRDFLPRTGSRVHSREGSELKLLEFQCAFRTKPPVGFEQWLQMGNVGEIFLKYKVYGKT